MESSSLQRIRAEEAAALARRSVIDRGALQLQLPADGSNPVMIEVPGQMRIEVRERGLRGAASESRGAIAYAGSSSTSYWNASDVGYEEWVLVDDAGDAPVAEWEIRGGSLRQVGDAVEILDASGLPRIRVTAPMAHASGGSAGRAWLTVLGQRLLLHTDVRGLALVDPVWTPAATASVARGFHTATALSNGKILVTGGYGVDGPLASAEIYDPASNTWSTTGSTTVARYDHTATLLSSGKVLVTGGADLSGSLATAEIYDPSTGAWSSAGTMASARDAHAAVRLPDGRVLVVGGLAETGTLASAEIYDPTSGTWTTTASMGSARFAHAATLLNNGRVLVTGGADEASLATAELFEPSAGAWSNAGSMQVARSYHTASLLQNGRVLVAGGLDYSAVAELFDPGTITWSSAGALATGRANHTSTVLQNGNVLVAGGDDGTATIASTEVYDVGTNAWAASGPMTVPRYHHTATLLGSGKVLVALGAGTAFLATSEIFDASAVVATIAISPALATVAPQQTVTFTASGGSGSGYVWSLDTNSSGGSITASGTYTAGSRAGATDVIRVTDSDGNATTRSIIVTTAVSISSTASVVPPRGTITFTASGGSGTGYVWSITAGPSGATITSTGFYSAGTMGNVTDVVRVVDSVGNSASVNVTVTAAISISPSISSIAPRSSVTFTATNGSGAGYVWSLTTNGSGASLTVDGVYTAGPIAGTDVIRVTDSLGNVASLRVAVTAALAISPATTTLATGGTITFTASGGSPAYIWSLDTNASGGSITSAGLYTAGTSGGVTDVVVVKDQLGSSVAARVSVTAKGGSTPAASSSSGGCGSTGGESSIAAVSIALLGARRSRRRRQSPTM